MFWLWRKNKKKEAPAVVIHQTCYEKLPPHHREQFTKAVAHTTVTHVTEVDNEEDFVLRSPIDHVADSYMLGSILADDQTSQTLPGNSSGYLPDTSPVYVEAPAQDYNPPVEIPSFDSAPAYDNSSYDSVSSYDSSSSSSSFDN